MLFLIANGQFNNLELYLLVHFLFVLQALKMRFSFSVLCRNPAALFQYLLYSHLLRISGEVKNACAN